MGASAKSSATDARRAALAARRVRVPKAAELIADAIRAQIASGELQPGAPLPNESELLRHFAVARPTVREALRILEIDGLIQIRPGRGGGARVRRPRGDELTRQLALFIWGRNITAEHLHDVRTALEALAAEGAARHRTEADIVELVARTEAVEANVGNLRRYLDANLAWHMEVVRASHNELLIAVMEVLSNAIHQATDIDVFDSDEVRRETLKIHRSILEAIVAQDAEAARRRMTRHVSAARDLALRPAPPPRRRPAAKRKGKRR